MRHVDTGSATITFAEADWVPRDKRAYRCPVVVEAEDGGGFSAYCPYLPGVVSQGATAEAMVACMREALAVVLEVCLASGMPIPWKQAVVPEGAKWITVEVSV